ncbi:MAG: bifunctional nuclease family protein [Bacteroidales bacterium]|nr:bifunctional nuclease family protein [Bacteroidales bacterium]
MDAEIKLSITGLVYNQTVIGTYGLVLSEEPGNRRFSVMIGEPEAQSIALKLNNKKSPRPLTHDLIHNLLNVFGSKLEKVLIYNMINDVFYSELHIKTGENTIILDARTSDAVALAVRSDSPIFIKSEILDIVGTVIEPQPEQTNDDKDEINIDAEELTTEELDLLSLHDLEELLNMAVQEEKYELAVNIRDAIKRKVK